MVKLTDSPFVIKGKIMHQRFFPIKNGFNYQSTYISVPLSKLSSLKKACFSLSKFNLFSFYPRNYGDEKGELEKWLRQILTQNNIKNIAEIVLVTHPKILGYVFNPVSFWLCFNNKKDLIAVLSEVNNTCGQKHSYLCFKENLVPIKNNDWLEAKKVFYVSPFMKIEGKYQFRFEISAKKINFFINYLVDGKLKLATYLQCDLAEFTNKNLLKNFVRIPFATFKTTFLIHYQAFKLFCKKVKFYKCPPKLEQDLTIIKSGKQNS